MVEAIDKKGDPDESPFAMDQVVDFFPLFFRLAIKEKYLTSSATIEGISSNGSITSHCLQPSGTVLKIVFRKGM